MARRRDGEGRLRKGKRGYREGKEAAERGVGRGYGMGRKSMEMGGGLRREGKVLGKGKGARRREKEKRLTERKESPQETKGNEEGKAE